MKLLLISFFLTLTISMPAIAKRDLQGTPMLDFNNAFCDAKNFTDTKLQEQCLTKYVKLGSICDKYYSAFLGRYLLMGKKGQGVLLGDHTKWLISCAKKMEKFNNTDSEKFAKSVIADQCTKEFNVCNANGIKVKSPPAKQAFDVRGSEICSKAKSTGSTAISTCTDELLKNTKSEEEAIPDGSDN